MLFDEFKSIILNRIREKYKGKYYTELIDLPKHNGGTEAAINISKSDIESGVVFKLDSYYEHLGINISIEDMLNDISEVLEKNEEKVDKINKLKEDFEAVKDRIVYRIINKNLNRAWLKQVPHRDFYDMAIDYYILLNNDNDGQMSIYINNEYIKKWGNSESELYEHANENTPRLIPCQFISMRENVLKIAESSKENGKFQVNIEEYLEVEKEFPLYELYQENSMYGATAFIYPNMLKEAAEMLESDLVIIPASIYEVLITPYKEGMNVIDIKALLEHVNDTALPFEEVLSNHVFRYSREADYLDDMWPDNPS